MYLFQRSRADQWLSFALWAKWTSFFGKRQNNPILQHVPVIFCFAKTKQLGSVSTNMHVPQTIHFSSTPLKRGHKNNMTTLTVQCKSKKKKKKVRTVIRKVRLYVQTLRCACYLAFPQKKNKRLIETEHKDSPTLRFKCICAKCNSFSLQKQESLMHYTPKVQQ